MPLFTPEQESYHPLPPELAPHFQEVPGWGPEHMWRTERPPKCQNGWAILLRSSKIHNAPRYQFESFTNPMNGGARVEHRSKWLDTEDTLATWARCLLEERCVWEPTNEET